MTGKTKCTHRSFIRGRFQGTPRCDICGKKGRRLRNGAAVCDDCWEVLRQYGERHGVETTGGVGGSA